MITGISVHDRVDWVFTITGMRSYMQVEAMAELVAPANEAETRQIAAAA